MPSPAPELADTVITPPHRATPVPILSSSMPSRSPALRLYRNRLTNRGKQELCEQSKELTVSIWSYPVALLQSPLPSLVGMEEEGEKMKATGGRRRSTQQLDTGKKGRASLKSKPTSNNRLTLKTRPTTR